MKFKGSVDRNQQFRILWKYWNLILQNIHSKREDKHAILLFANMHPLSHCFICLFEIIWTSWVHRYFSNVSEQGPSWIKMNLYLYISPDTGRCWVNLTVSLRWITCGVSKLRLHLVSLSTVRCWVNLTSSFCFCLSTPFIVILISICYELSLKIFLFL